MKIENVKVGDTFLFAAVANEFKKTGVEPDDNGLMPLVLAPLCGTSPRTLNVVAGTIAETANFLPNERYAVQAIYMGIYTDEETGKETHSFNFTNAGKISFSEFMEWKKSEPLKAIIPMQDNQVAVQNADGSTTTASVEDEVEESI
jgi:hypothetical protein